MTKVVWSLSDTRFAKHVMVSAGVCYGGKGRLHFIPDKVKVKIKLYVEIL